MIQQENGELTVRSVEKHNCKHQLIFMSRKTVDRLAWSNQLVISREWQMEDLADVDR